MLSWLGIMINNIRVAFRFFVEGILVGIFTFTDLSGEGIRLGVFNHFMASKGQGIDFWLVVFVHGTLEITAIIIAAAAGFVLGKSYLFPGTITRFAAFKQGAKDGVKLIIGLVPVFALAAFFEGFFTRLYNDLSVFTTVLVLLSVLFVIWYFIIYPVRLAAKMNVRIQEEEI